MLSLDWKETGEYKLAHSNLTISIPQGYNILIGSDAATSLSLFKRKAGEFLEAAVFDETLNDICIFENVVTGHFFVDYWSNPKPNTFLKSIKNKYKEIEISREGSREVHEVRLLVELTLDKSTNALF
ncbi:MAG TPA: hypothetical protein VGP47_11635 [Parachlamydiaceae bacterium]|nr:hypothetical protein [Parachlamydiaceae bacterium]